MNSVRGLCGNYDGIVSNEYTMADGTVVRDLNEFGDSWVVSEQAADTPCISLKCNLWVIVSCVRCNETV